MLGFVALLGCTPERSDCNDGLDNDGDGFIDGDDPGCVLNNGRVEAPDPPPPACRDDEDNDGDGLVDFPNDPGCSDTEDDDETDPPPPPPQCNDGVDNNGDGRVDFPYDPGCESLDDETEDATPPVRQCSDGMDNDGDGLTDYPADPGCSSAADDDESNQQGTGDCGPSLTVMPLPTDTWSVTQDQMGGDVNQLQGACGGLGPERVFSFEITEPRALVVSTRHPETTLDTVLYVRTACRASTSELGCVDDEAPSRAGTLFFPRIDPGTYFVVVDAYDSGSTGTFKLTVDRHVPQGEICDPAGPDTCAPGLVCRKLLPASTDDTCEVPECQDGLDNDDDGNTDYPWDPGCTTATDNSEAIPPGDPIPACGNGLDDDGDGLIDYPADPGCREAADNIEIDECVPGVEVLELTEAGASGTTVGGSTSFAGSCGFYTMTQPERVHGFILNRPLSLLRFSTAGSSFNNVLYVREGDCASGAEIACAGAGGVTDQTVTIASPTLGETYFVFVDGDFSAAGDYVLSVSGELATGSACDPGSTQFVCEFGSSCDAGSSTCVPSQCNDGVDNDGDGLADADDPGCVSVGDNDETDPAVMPQCGDGADNDGDTLIDFPADPGCSRASDSMEAECGDSDPEVDVTYLQSYSGTTTGATNDFMPGCVGTSTAPDIAHSFYVPGELATLEIDTNPSFDTVLYVRPEDCTAADLACNDEAGSPFPFGVSKVTLSDVPPGGYFIIVDGWSSNSGAYSLNITGVVKAGQPCDPEQVKPGFLSCEMGLFCVDMGGGFLCQ